MRGGGQRACGSEEKTREKGGLLGRDDSRRQRPEEGAEPRKRSRQSSGWSRAEPASWESWARLRAAPMGLGRGCILGGPQTRGPVSSRQEKESSRSPASRGVGCHPLLQGRFQPRGHTHVSYLSCLGRRVVFLSLGPPGKPVPGLTLPTETPKAMGSITSMLQTRKLRLERLFDRQ